MTQCSHHAPPKKTTLFLFNVLARKINKFAINLWTLGRNRVCVDRACEFVILFPLAVFDTVLWKVPRKGAEKSCKNTKKMKKILEKYERSSVAVGKRVLPHTTKAGCHSIFDFPLFIVDDHMRDTQVDVNQRGNSDWPVPMANAWCLSSILLISLQIPHRNFRAPDYSWHCCKYWDPPPFLSVQEPFFAVRCWVVALWPRCVVRPGCWPHGVRFSMRTALSLFRHPDITSQAYP